MSKNKHVRWFLNEIDKLKNENIISQSIGEKLFSYYSQKIKPVNLTLLLMVCFGILGAILLTIGAVLVIVNYNFIEIPKEVKTGLAFLILLVPQILCGYYLFKNKESIVLKEVFSIILSLLFGVSIAFLGQIYQISNDLTSFLLIWALSTLLVIYIFDSMTSFIFYLILVISIGSEMQISGDIGLAIYPLLMLLVPFIIMKYKKKSEQIIKLINYSISFTLIICLGISLEKSVPGLWTIAYSNLFVVFYLFGLLFENDEDTLLSSPFKISGVIGIGIFAYILSFYWPWEEIGWHYYRSSGKFHELASFFDYFVCIALPALTIVLVVFNKLKKRLINYSLVFFGVLIIVVYLLLGLKNINDLISVWIINLYIFILCGHTFYLGYKSKSLLAINASMLLACLTLFSRFFDEDLGILFKGVSFMVLGLIILIINFAFIKRIKKGFKND